MGAKKSDQMSPPSQRQEKSWRIREIQAWYLTICRDQERDPSLNLDHAATKREIQAWKFTMYVVAKTRIKKSGGISFLSITQTSSKNHLGPQLPYPWWDGWVDEIWISNILDKQQVAAFFRAIVNSKSLRGSRIKRIGLLFLSSLFLWLSFFQRPSVWASTDLTDPERGLYLNTIRKIWINFFLSVSRNLEVSPFVPLKSVVRTVPRFSFESGII